MQKKKKNQIAAIFDRFVNINNIVEGKKVPTDDAFGVKHAR